MLVEPTIDESRFKVEFLSPEDYDAVHRLQVDVFTEENLETKRCRISKWAWGEFSTWLNKGWEKAGLTQIIRDRDADDAVVAFLFCKELNLLEPFVSNFEELCRDSPGIRRLVQHGGQVCGQVGRVPRLGPTLAIETGGTKVGYEGLGLATYLRWRLCQLAKDKGYYRLKVETSSMGTRHIYHDKLGFEILGQSRYVDWQAEDGAFPFRDEFQMPDDFVFTCQQKILKDMPDTEDRQQLRVMGAGSDEVNGTYIRLPGARFEPGGVLDAWVHASQAHCFITKQDGETVGHPEWGKKWLLFWPKGPCYVNSAAAAADSPPQGRWELAPWVAELKLGEPGAAPAPLIEHCRESPRSCALL